MLRTRHSSSSQAYNRSNEPNNALDNTRDCHSRTITVPPWQFEVQITLLLCLQFKPIVFTDSRKERTNTNLKGATSRFSHLEKFNLNFSSSSFVIRVNLLHPQPSLFLCGLLLSLWCFSVLVNYYFQVSFNLKVILYVAKITQNVMTEFKQDMVY